MKETAWLSDLNAAMPVDGSKIAGFKTWLCWNGFDKTSHLGFDFACYLREDDKIILGLPELKVCSILDGRVKAILFDTPLAHFFSILSDVLLPPFRRKYYCSIVIEHDIGGQKLYSIYSHVNPNRLIKGRGVKKGEVIGRLYKSPSLFHLYGDLVHLHFALSQEEPLVSIKSSIPRSVQLLRKLLKLDMDSFRGDYLIDPVLIFPSLTSYSCDPQWSSEFSIPKLGFKSQRPITANFKKLQLMFNPRKL